MRPDVVISIDIGLSGGITFFDTVSGEVLAVYEMPTSDGFSSKGNPKKVFNIPDFKFIFEIPKVHNDDAVVVFEDVHTLPFQNIVSMGTLMEQKGVIRGMACALGYSSFAINPKTWQKHFEIVPPKDMKDKAKRKKWLKEKSLEIARVKFPEWAETKLAKNTAHGLSDSMLIGKYYLDTWGANLKEDAHPTVKSELE